MISVDAPSVRVVNHRPAVSAAVLCTVLAPLPGIGLSAWDARVAAGWGRGLGRRSVPPTLVSGALHPLWRQRLHSSGAFHPPRPPAAGPTHLHRIGLRAAPNGTIPGGDPATVF